MSDVVKHCSNPKCTGINPVIGNWCTARACKEMRALGIAAKKQQKMATACAAVGVAVPAALHTDVGRCYALHSVHGVVDCDFPSLTGKQLEKARKRHNAPPGDPKQLCFLVYGTFAMTEDDYDNDRGCKDVVKAVKYKELYENLGDDDRGKLHKYAREKSESLRLSLKRARED